MSKCIFTLGLLTLLWATTAAAAVWPWYWTPAQAARNLSASKPAAMPGDYAMTTATCMGSGKPLAGRFTSFKCQATFKPTKLQTRPRTVTLWMRVRPYSSGQGCVSFVSLAAIPAACLAKDGPRTLGTKPAAEIALKTAIQQRDGSPYDGELSCTGIGAGYYPCSFGGAEHATVVFHATGAKVTFSP